MVLQKKKKRHFDIVSCPLPFTRKKKHSFDLLQGLLYSGHANAQLESKTGVETVLPYI